MLWAMLLGTPLSAQRRRDLPPPDSSRAPLLTRAAADSIRYQTAYLHTAELLQALQAGDATTMGTLLENATLSSTTCGSLSETIAKVGARARKIALSDGGTSLAVFFDKITVADSSTSLTVTAEIVLVPATSGAPLRDSVMLVLDRASAVWTREAGLLSALCTL
jgi:hypothetical protein